MARFTQKILAVGMAALVCLPLSSCTTNPITNQKFSSFNSCVAANLTVAGLGGVLGRTILIGAGVDKSTANTVAVSGTLIAAYSAWQKCAASFQEVKYSDEVSRDAMPATGLNAPGAAPSLHVDELSITATKFGEPLITTVRYSLYAGDRAKKDIPVVERRIFAAPTQPEIPAVNIPNNIVANQGSRTASGKYDTPPDPDNSAPKGPYTFSFELEAEGMKTAATVEYFYDGKKHSAVIAGPARSRHGNNDANNDKQSPGTTQHRKAKPANPPVKKNQPAAAT